MNKKYADMLYMPHHASKKYPQMTMKDRAAQFSPFSALNGYDSALKETERLTDKKIELGEEALADLKEKIFYIEKHLREKPYVEITYFQPDSEKSGGGYITTSGYVKKIDKVNKAIVMESKTKISMELIYKIEL